jgi:predicted sulfurtransferase
MIKSALPIRLLPLALVALLPVFSVAAEDEFPLRKDFPGVKVMSTEELTANYDKTLIIDVRSQLEFDVVHVAKAVLVPVGKATFIKQLSDAAKGDKAAAIAFYCNGITCHKSYEAA